MQWQLLWSFLMPLICRPARDEDLERADKLVVASINDLTERHGFGPMASPSPPWLQRFSLKDDPDGLWVVDDDGEMRGFAFSWVCGDLWFLAQLFVSPSLQGTGIGNELMRKTLHHAEKAGATNKVLITFAFNRVSQGLYIRHGMFPRLPLYFVGGPSASIKGMQQKALRTKPVENTASHLRMLVDIDRVALGVSREKHHKFLLDDRATKGILLFVGDVCAGYAYIANGHVGPLAVSRREFMEPAFATALGLAAESGSSKVSAFLPGTSEAAFSMAIQHGMRITFPMMLMSSREFGDWNCYLPRNPGFM
jgi:ribosomal protein S18 acetylase RimI-like enzyme